MICMFIGHTLYSLNIDDGMHYNIPALKCRVCRKIWNMRGEDQGWAKGTKKTIHLGRGPNFEPYFGLTRDKRYKSLTTKELARAYIGIGLAQKALSPEQARELRKQPPAEVLKLFGAG
jgi:hypothetical protein